MNNKYIKRQSTIWSFVIMMLSIETISSGYIYRTWLWGIGFCFTVLCVGQNHIIFNKRNNLKQYIFLGIFILWLGISGFLWEEYKLSYHYFLFVYCSFVALLFSNLGKNIKMEIWRKLARLNIFIHFFMSFIFPDIVWAIGGFGGIFREKNYFGYVMLITYLILLEEYRSSKRMTCLIWGLISGIFIIMSHSTTSIIFMLSVSVFFLLGNDVIKSLLKWFPIAVVVFSLYLVCYEKILSSRFAYLFYNVVGKDLRFTGRLNLWLYTIEMIKKRPLIGYGYGGLWGDLDQAAIRMNSMGFVFNGGHSHSGWLEILHSGGIIGLLFFLFLLLFIYKNYVINNKEINFFELTMVFIIMFGSFIYSNTISEGIFWFIFCLLYNETVLFAQEKQGDVQNL